jgi:hypothetical protein
VGIKKEEGQSEGEEAPVGIKREQEQSEGEVKAAPAKRLRPPRPPGSRVGERARQREAAAAASQQEREEADKVRQQEREEQAMRQEDFRSALVMYRCRSEAARTVTLKFKTLAQRWAKKARRNKKYAEAERASAEFFEDQFDTLRERASMRAEDEHARYLAVQGRLDLLPPGNRAELVRTMKQVFHYSFLG